MKAASQLKKRQGTVSQRVKRKRQEGLNVPGIQPEIIMVITIIITTIIILMPAVIIVTITIMHLATAVIIITEMTRTIHSLVIWNSLTAGRYVRVSLR